MMPGQTSNKMPSDTEREIEMLEAKVAQLKEKLHTEKEEKKKFQVVRDEMESFWKTRRERLDHNRTRLQSLYNEIPPAMKLLKADMMKVDQHMLHGHTISHATLCDVKMDSAVSAAKKQQTQIEVEQRQKMYYTHSARTLLEAENLQDDLSDLHHQKRIAQLEIDMGYEVSRILRKGKEEKEEKLDKIDAEHIEKVERPLYEHIERLTNVLQRFDDFHTVNRLKKTLLERDLANLLKKKALFDKEQLPIKMQIQQKQEALQEAEQKLPKLRKQMEQMSKTVILRAESKIRDKDNRKKLRNLSMQQEVLQQVVDEVEHMCKELRAKQTKAIFDVQQKSGMKKMLLDNKLKAVNASLEKVEDHVMKVKQASELEAKLQAKKAEVIAFGDDVTRACDEYTTFMKTNTQKLNALGVPLHDKPTMLLL